MIGKEENKFISFIKKNKFFASRKMGQNFLINENIKKKIVDSLEIKPDDHVLEIGPGFGALTKIVLSQTKNLTVVELDKRLVEFLKQEYKELRIINIDVLKFDFKEFNKDTQYKIISNLPYSISSKIIFKILKYANFSQSVLMVQKEMADRITAKVGTKKYNNFTVLLRITSEIKKLFDVSNNCFFPKPEVDSTVISFERKKDFDFTNFEKLESFLLKCFSQKRKTIFNNLKNYFPKQKIEEVFNKHSIIPTTRPENIKEELYLKMCFDFYDL
ncbi:ribosomal RNA small subunit methyltransferase A [Malacoplasma penetrans]|uniref:Ribosomal RNA small subunit methyltransferase A n=1 Tax=Malacoplasma penetrans (strain HF-2) TaxID=272633 RepID=RSMA_MALP2|nr:16S rRNA (adenine(1518)-N(6)/adenine(1519)-N(6))-dimethyltransferase RsmA [Malacoplasma penetrans]Q8EU92.1 RecName: Full=Ribosomal RNA small subunit methyltransferase A; AltName: Full=16S rRNA (adenine(1518)-N(6)/adenine(1519)-N(6))-dimethyltransferase; AltName: Full=16S rRNA dimethyladenosine transferase; AltName: Full=16S rRNA dimethylase; AltName: Full=S-adenosylmethionine-6-N', N'-adenosyl(rRNA) dimethyltransferase [Malacoplasma penetrans HF-2]RXY96877.1 ribosomal RNA small subunit methylt